MGYQPENCLRPCSFWRVCSVDCSAVFPGNSWFTSAKDVTSFTLRATVRVRSDNVVLDSNPNDGPGRMVRYSELIVGPHS